MFPATVTTERLLLRRLEIADADALFTRIGSDPEITRYMSWKTNESVSESRDFIASVTDPTTIGMPPWGHVWGICIEGDPRPSGTIGVVPSATRLELGYALCHAQWGRGLMTEACSGLCNALWSNEDVWRIQAYCHIENTGSSRVLEKCGFRYEGVARRMHVMPQLGSEPQDCCLYAQVRDDLR